MKKSFLNIIMSAITLAFGACANQGGNRIVGNTSGGGGYVTKQIPTNHTVQEEVPPPATTGLAVFGGQPSTPTPSARANPTTWGAAFGGPAYNEMRPKNFARLENPAPGTPILVDRANGWVWKAHCNNRMTPARSQTRSREVTTYQTVQEFVPAPAGGGHTIVDNRKSDFRLSILEGASASFTYVGGGSSRGYCPPPQRVGYRPEPQRPPQGGRCHPEGYRYCKKCIPGGGQQYAQRPPSIHINNRNVNDNWNGNNGWGGGGGGGRHFVDHLGRPIGPVGTPDPRGGFF